MNEAVAAIYSTADVTPRTASHSAPIDSAIRAVTRTAVNNPTFGSLDLDTYHAIQVALKDVKSLFTCSNTDATDEP